ncbi:LOW QUALITY PROTEIN: cyclic AMP response element-binding protein A [Drosophila nasuta]|uniref:LOW QUALITY PROTEIN: cyclic AMP response element-binding protein A n=1 Tax=Drosophila nasuta TaxID=42062 RepID=UPI00295E3BB6|nr:LOW QUALITY PROTEIN: cyclic AMP response element-binding protein A [Drosophila nasuta]
MDSFYDGDLKDIWDSDLDPTESLKISSDHDMHDWFYDRDVKDPAVILHDKLISDALLNGTGPIKTEHSYSLNSDGDSLPDSPKSLQAKIDDMDDECYSGSGRITIDPKCLTLHPPTRNNRSSAMLSMSSTSANPALHTAITELAPTNAVLGRHGHGDVVQQHCGNSVSNHSNSSSGSSNSMSVALEHFQQAQHLADMYDDNDCSSSVSSAREGSISPDICSDIEIDEAVIKDEPMSPDSSCPASPNSQNSSAHQLSINLANLQTELLFDQKHGGLLLTANSNNLIKSQQQHQLLLGQSSQSQSSLMVPKIAIKSEKQSAASNNSSSGKSHAYGIPLTPPSSLPSDDSEGNLSPEHLYAPLSPNASAVSISAVTNAAANANSADSANNGSARRAASALARAAASSSNGASNNAATSTRQPIHTPLISSQPKGSTGTLLLTEEEKRTLLAEGYPIPQKLPLTKAEEKSLKKIRRKIKNKISAQESRRKKKEYMDQLERRVEILVTENHDYKKRLESLEETNANLLSQLHKLQAVVSKHNVKKS